MIFEGESVCQSIGNKSFAECKKLTSLQLPSSITTVDYYAFENCKSIKHAEIPTSVIPYIHKSSLESLVLIDGDKIPENSFGGCRKLRSVVIAGNIKNIGEGAFRGCISLLSVTIGSRVTSISTEAFQYCSNLVEVYNLSALGITVNGSYGHGYAGAYAMVIHTSLDEESILTTTQDGYIFAINNEGKFYLMSYIGTEAELCLPEDFNGNAYAIYQYAFYENKIVTSVTVPSSIVEIGKMAFADCFFLTSVVFENTIGWSAGETDISESDLSDTTKAAEYLTETYTNYGWKCEN